jgi:hypothetical protein
MLRQHPKVPQNLFCPIEQGVSIEQSKFRRAFSVGVAGSQYYAASALVLTAPITASILSTSSGNVPANPSV